MAWTNSGNIRGPVGATGATGAQGPTGPTGPTGPAGTTTWSGITDKPAVIAAGSDAAGARNAISAEYTGNKGVAGGYCALDANGLVPSSSLPSFVDDVIEGATTASFPATGSSGVIYTALDTNKIYRWGGSSYVEISPSPGSTDAVPEGSTNLYYTAARADGRITAAVGSTVQAYSATLDTYAANGSAPKLTTARTVQTNLASTSSASFDGTANITPGVTGTLPVTSGGTGVTSITANSVVVGGGTGAVGTVAPSTSGNLLTSNGTAWTSATPAFIQRNVSTITASATLGSAAYTDYVTFVSNSDANLSSVTALLAGDGSNNSTTITDSSPLAANWTASGNAKLNTTTKKYGTASIAMDASANTRIAATAAASNFTFGTGDFTVEFWLYLNSVTGTQIVAEWRSALNTVVPVIYMNGSSIRYYTSTTDGGAGADRITGATLSTATWYHIALCRSGTSTRLFVDGTQSGSTYTDSLNYTIGTSRPWFGQSGISGESLNVNGYLDDIRITKGVARYTGNFTAPTAALPVPTVPTLPTAVSNTNRYALKNIQSGVAVTVNTTSSQTIDGSSTLSIAAGSTSNLISDGTNWRTV